MYFLLVLGGNAKGLGYLMPRQGFGTEVFIFFQLNEVQIMRKQDTPDGERIKLHQNTLPTIKELDIWGSRLINSSLVGENQGVLFGTDKYCAVDITKYAALGSLYYAEAFNKALEVANKLLITPLSYTLPSGATHTTTLIYDIIHDMNMRVFLVNWNKNFIPLISGHMKAGEFISPRVGASSFSSNKRYCLYLMLEKYLHLLEKQNTFIIPKQEIRSILGLKEGEYSEFKMVNAKIIKPALKDIYNKFGIPLTVKVSRDRVIFSYEAR